MKKILLSTAIITGLSFTGFTQKITFAVSAGISYANVFIKADTTAVIGLGENAFIKTDSNEVKGLGPKNRFTGGISANIPISKYFSFQPAINFLQKGAKFMAASDFTKEPTSTVNLTLNYIEVPLNLMFNTHNKATNKKADDFFFGIGPSFAFATSGKMEEKNSRDSVSTEKIKFGSGDNYDIKPIDIGANIMMGCLFFNNLFLSVNYTIGFSNLSNNKDIRWRNNYLGFKLGYSFGSKNK